MPTRIDMPLVLNKGAVIDASDVSAATAATEQDDNEEPRFMEGEKIDGYTGVSRVQVTETQLLTLIEIIHKATMCDDWKKWVLEYKKKTKIFPPFLRCFYNLTSRFDEDNAIENTSLSNMIEKAKIHLVKMNDNIEKIAEDSKGYVEAWIADNPRVKLDSVTDCGVIAKHLKEKRRFKIANHRMKSAEVTSLNDLNETTDSFFNHISWSVLSLFYHPGICEVPNGSDVDKRFAFWPTCAPKVNNRLVDYRILINEEGKSMIPEFVDSMETSWDVQPVRIVPYCVTSDVTKSDVKLGPVIATTFNSSQRNGGEMKKVDDSECFAGKLLANKIQFSEIEKLYYSLTGQNITDGHIFGRCAGMKNEDKAMLGLSHCLEHLGCEGTFNSLKTPQDWCNLYVRLSVKKSEAASFDILPFCPTSMVDLVHKTRMLFLSTHAVRFSFMEGQKRSTASTYALTGFLPQETFVFHGDLVVKDFTIGNDHNYFNEINNYEETEDSEESEDTCKATFRNGGKTVSATVLHLKTLSGEFDQDTIDICQAFSRKLVQTGNQEQGRNWGNVVEQLATENKMKNWLTRKWPAWSVPSLQIEFYHKFRVDFFGLIYMKERQSKCLLDDCNDLTDVTKSLAGSEKEKETFVDLCLYKKVDDKKKTKKKIDHKPYKVKIYETYVDFKAIPSPSMVHALCTIFVSVTFGNYKGFQLLKNVASLQGKRSTAYRFREGFEFFKIESSHVPRGLFNHANATNVLKAFVFLPIEALIDVLIGQSEQLGRVSNKYAVRFRLRCILMKQLFSIFEDLGVRAEVPDCYERFPQYKWLTQDFLSIKQLKHMGTGLQYSASNIPVVIGLIIHFIGTGDITVPLNLKSLCKADGSMIMNEPVNDYRDAIKLRFRFTTLFDGNLMVPFDKAIMMLIYGCDPYKIPEGQESSFTPREDVNLLFEKLSGVPFGTVMGTVLSGGEIKKDVKDEKPLPVTGYLPDVEYKALKNKFELPGMTSAVREGEILSYLKNKEQKYLALSANLRFHINFMESKKKAIAISAQSLKDMPFPESDLASENTESELLTSLGCCKFLKTQAQKKHLKEEDDIGEGPTTPKILDHFPAFLRDQGIEMGKVSEKISSKLAFPKVSYEHQWTFLKVQSYKGEDVQCNEPKHFLNSNPRTQTEKEVLSLQKTSRNDTIENSFKIPKKHRNKPESSGFATGTSSVRTRSSHDSDEDENETLLELKQLSKASTPVKANDLQTPVKDNKKNDIKGLTPTQMGVHELMASNKKRLLGKEKQKQDEEQAKKKRKSESKKAATATAAALNKKGKMGSK